MPRPPDLAFGTNEKLWRRVGKKDVKHPHVKGNSLRLQVSVTREKHGKREAVPNADKPGVAEALAQSVVEIEKDAIAVVCVDDPTDENPGHALIAMVVDPGDETSQECINAAREALALKFQVVVDPRQA
ncbi:MAG TPA: hypothetical protein VEK07_00205 [Polyangiaceae bacterium]|nr:hypothetical protein [Polyangiaceae bacterium]